MKAPVLFLLLILASAEVFACESCQCNCSAPHPTGSVPKWKCEAPNPAQSKAIPCPLARAASHPVVCVRPGALIRQLFSSVVFPFAVDDCNECNAETESYCDFSPCFGTWALLCDQCGAGEKRFCCVRCGQSGARIQAMLCPQCSSIRRYCLKCGKPGARIPARLCEQCGYGEKKKECVKCGKMFR